MKRLIYALLTAGTLAGAMSGCAYGGAAAKGDTVVVLRNDAFLFGALRKVFVCKVSEAGLTGCNAADAP